MAIRIQNLEVKTFPSLSGPKHLKAAPVPLIKNDTSYELALIRIRETGGYRALECFVHDPYRKEKNFVIINDFLENHVPRFYRYLDEREAGLADPDPVNAARVLEYTRLLSRLTEEHPEFNERVHQILVRQQPGGAGPVSFPGLSELVQKLEQLNRRDFPMKKSLSSPAPSPAPAKNPPGPFPAPERAELEVLLQKLVAELESYLRKNSPRSVEFSFEAKCTLLGPHDWGGIIDRVRAEFPGFAGLTRLDLLKYLKQTTGDPRADKIYYHLRQFNF